MNKVTFHFEMLLNDAQMHNLNLITVIHTNNGRHPVDEMTDKEKEAYWRELRIAMFQFRAEDGTPVTNTTITKEN